MYILEAEEEYFVHKKTERVDINPFAKYSILNFILILFATSGKYILSVIFYEFYAFIHMKKITLNMSIV
jgi:hypothetical protein